MNIFVCIKQVPDATDVQFDDNGKLKREKLPVTINALDEHATEEALRIKEKLGEGSVTVIGMGPDKAVDSLKHCIAMGADEAIHLNDAQLEGSDALATSYALARVIAQTGEPNLILCGAETMDGGTAYVGQGIARQLRIPCVTFVTGIEEIGADKAVVQRMTEEGCDRIEVELPAVLTVVKGINEPRITSLKGKMRAKKAKPQVLDAAGVQNLEADRIGWNGSPTRVVNTFPPAPRPEGVVLEGEPDEMAEKLFEHLKG